MVRRLIRPLIVALASLIAFVTPAASPSQPEGPSVLQRFLAHGDSRPDTYRALRRLDARNDHFGKSAWMDVWTEADRSGVFQFHVVAEGGSDYIRSHVFIQALERERAMWASGEPDRAALDSSNYVFEDRGIGEDGLASLAVTPRRRDVLLINGALFVRPEDGELIRIEGRLSKAPSFWTRRVDIVRRYERIAGVRVPVAIESVANVLLAGRSTFRMRYEYEIVNGSHVGAPIPRDTGN